MFSCARSLHPSLPSSCNSHTILPLSATQLLLMLDSSNLCDLLFMLVTHDLLNLSSTATKAAELPEAMIVNVAVENATESLNANE